MSVKKNKNAKKVEPNLDKIQEKCDHQGEDLDSVVNVV